MKICLTVRVWCIDGFLQKILMHVLKYDNSKQISNDKSIIKNWKIRITVNTDDE